MTSEKSYANEKRINWLVERLPVLYRSGADWDAPSGSATPIPDLSGIDLPAGEYGIRAKLQCRNGVSAVVNGLGFTGTFTARIFINSYGFNNGATVNPDSVYSNSAYAIPAFLTSYEYGIELDGHFELAADDTFGLTMWKSGSATITCRAGSFMELRKVS